MLSPDEAAARGLAVVVGCHASRHVAVAFTLHPSNIHKVPGRREAGDLLGQSETLEDKEDGLLHLADTTPPAAPEETS